MYMYNVAAALYKACIMLFYSPEVIQKQQMNHQVANTFEFIM